MNESLSDLYQLQLIDTQIARVEEARAGLDDGGALREELSRRESEQSEKKKHFTRREAELRDRELELKGNEEKIKTLQDKMYGGKVRNPKELQDMQQDVESVTRHKGKLEEMVLLLMDEVESLSGELKTCRAAIEENKSSLAGIEADYRQRVTSLDSQMAELTTRRASASAGLEELLLDRYDSVRQRCDNLAVVKIEDDICPGCHTTITNYLLRRLKESDDHVTCENCHRMFYWAAVREEAEADA